MRVIVVGGAGLAEQVATTLARAGDEVAVVETDQGSQAALTAAGLRLVPGDPVVPATLEAAGVRLADVLIAATRSDAVNLVVSLLAKRRFSVGRVIARVNDLANEELFGPAWGVDALVSPATSVVALVRPDG